MNATSAKTTWTGWYRQSKQRRWLKLAEADDYGDALNALLDATKLQPRGGEMLVTQSSDPNTDATARKPRRMY